MRSCQKLKKCFFVVKGLHNAHKCCACSLAEEKLLMSRVSYNLISCINNAVIISWSEPAGVMFLTSSSNNINLTLPLHRKGIFLSFNSFPEE